MEVVAERLIGQATVTVLAANYNIIALVAGGGSRLVLRASLMDDPVAARWEYAQREVAVAQHLDASGVWVTPPRKGGAGPVHVQGDVVVSAWDYVPPTAREPLDPTALVDRVSQLAAAMASCPAPLPRLGAWSVSRRAAGFLRSARDPGLGPLLGWWAEMDQWLGAVEDRQLRPCHGDAHPANLLPGPSGWHWTDFEDAALMPPLWDLASMAANVWLTHGRGHPLVQAMAASLPHPEDREQWQRVVWARAVLSTVVNTWWARTGAGDAAFAALQRTRLPALARDLGVL